MSFLKGFEKIISKDQLRPSMGFVLIRDGYAIATDAHKLVKVDLKLYGLNEEDISNLNEHYVDLDVLNELKLKKGQSLTFGKGSIEVSSSGRVKPLKSLQLISVEESGIVYPGYDAVMGKGEEAIVSTSISAKLYSEIEYVYEQLPITKKEDLVMVFTGMSQGIRIQNFNGSFEALLMPRSHSGYEDLSKQ